MREEIIQLRWKKGLFDQINLKTRCGKKLGIISPGFQNFNAGPDFFNARIRIGTIEWAGNVEVHKRSSDWVKHSHHLDGAYNNVILHVVQEDDVPTFSASGRQIPILQLPDSGNGILKNCSLQTEEPWLNCHQYISGISQSFLRHWFTRLQAQRLAYKNQIISQMLVRNNFNWEKTLYGVLASAYGLPINALPFEMMFGRIPFDLLIQNRENLHLLEAIFFGQAGFLSQSPRQGPYEKELFNSYRSLRKELKNNPIDHHLWKFLRLRPASFPTLRISQYANLLHTRHPMLDIIMESAGLTDLRQILRVGASTYWDSHYLFGKASPESVKMMGHQAIQILIINGLVPFLYSIGQIKRHSAAIYLGNKFLQESRAESNHIIKKWATFGIKPEGAFESQALIQLHNNFCKQKRCMDCQIGAELMKRFNYEKEKP